MEEERDDNNARACRHRIFSPNNPIVFYGEEERGKRKCVVAASSFSVIPPHHPFFQNCQDPHPSPSIKSRETFGVVDIRYRERADFQYLLNRASLYLVNTHSTPCFCVCFYDRNSSCFLLWHLISFVPLFLKILILYFSFVRR